MFDDFSPEANQKSDYKILNQKIEELRRELKAVQEELREKQEELEEIKSLIQEEKYREVKEELENQELIQAQADEIARLKRLLYKTM